MESLKRRISRHASIGDVPTEVVRTVRRFEDLKRTHSESDVVKMLNYFSFFSENS